MRFNLDLGKVASIRVNTGCTMTIVPIEERLEIITVDISDMDVNSVTMATQSPVFSLKQQLDKCNFKLSGGWLFVNQLFVNQNEVWQAANPDFDNGV